MATDPMKSDTCGSIRARIDRFRDIHLHAASVRDWRQSYNQITGGKLMSSLMQFSAGRAHIFRECINQRVVQQGAAPAGRMCFAVPLKVPGAARMQGRAVPAGSVFFLRADEEFMFHMPEGTDMLALTFATEDIEQALDLRGVGAAAMRALLRQPVVQVEPRRHATVSAGLLDLACHALSSPHLFTGAAAEARLQADLLDALLALIEAPGCDPCQRPASSPHSFIVEKCHHLTLDAASIRPNVRDLCATLRVSRRTLQNSFRNVAETTPVNYLRCVRLNGVRRRLISTRADQARIADIAAEWGFTHLSHFAALYEELFGELPSQTTRLRPTRCAVLERVN